MGPGYLCHLELTQPGKAHKEPDGWINDQNLCQSLKNVFFLLCLYSISLSIHYVYFTKLFFITYPFCLLGEISHKPQYNLYYQGKEEFWFMMTDYLAGVGQVKWVIYTQGMAFLNGGIRANKTVGKKQAWKQLEPLGKQLTSHSWNRLYDLCSSLFLSNQFSYKVPKNYRGKKKKRMKLSFSAYLLIQMSAVSFLRERTKAPTVFRLTHVTGDKAFRSHLLSLTN